MTDYSHLKTEGLPEDWRYREIRGYEKGDQIDLQKQFREMNHDLLKNYGRDHLTYRPELTNKAHAYWKANEARYAHGYPLTAWL